MALNVLVELGMELETRIAYHLDLRLQVDGATFSWAVPRGFMNLDPGGHRLAVETTL